MEAQRVGGKLVALGITSTNPGSHFVARMGVKSPVSEEQTTLTLHHDPQKFLNGNSWINDAVKLAQNFFNTESRARALINPCELRLADYRSEINLVPRTSLTFMASKGPA